MVGLENVPVCTVKLVAFAFAFQQTVGRVHLRRISPVHQAMVRLSLLILVMFLCFLRVPAIVCYYNSS